MQRRFRRIPESRCGLARGADNSRTPVRAARWWYLFLGLAASGETPAAVDPWEGEFLLKRWTMAEGLPQSSPNALAIGAHGYLWVGTEMGLARFDGDRFKVWDTRHGLPGERVVRLLATARGLWVGTEPGALSFFDGRRFTTVLAHQAPAALATDGDGTVWVATRETLHVVEGGGLSLSRFTPEAPPGIRALLLDPAGGLYAAHRAGISHYREGKAWRRLPLGDIEPPVSALALVDGDLWAAGANGFWRRKAGSWFRVTDSVRGAPGIRALEGGGALLWSRAGGLRRYHRGRVARVPELAGTSDLVFAVLPDGPDTIWLGIADEGLLRLRRPIVESRTQKDGLPTRAIHGVLQDASGRLWLGSLEAGITRFGDGELRRFGVEEGLPGAAVMSIAESSTGEIWVGTPGGLAVLRGDRFQAVECTAPGFRPSLVAEIIPGGEGSMLFAQNGGVWRHEAGATTPVIEEGTVRSAEFLYRDRRGTLWLGGDGLCSHSGRGARCYPVQPGPARSFLRCAFEPPSGAIWFCTYGAGLCRLEDDGSFRCVSEEQGLPHRTVHNVLPDRLGWVWLPSNRGLGRLRPEELEKAFSDPSHTIRADVFGLEDGLPDLEFNGGVPPRGVVLEDGRLALPTMGGLALVDPRLVAEATRSPPVTHMDGLVVNGSEVMMNGNLRLPAGSDRVTFRFTSVFPRSPGSLRYRYRLDGRDTAWVAGGGERSASYTGLAPGSYRFRVQASAGSGPWSSAAVLPFELLPLFWQTWWFLAGALLAGGGLAAHLVRLRIQRAVGLERLRLRIATDLHDELGSELSGISMASALLEESDDLADTTRHALGEIRASAGQLLPRMRDIIWLIDPKKDGVGPLVLRLESIARSLSAGLDLDFRSNAADTDLKLAMSRRRDLLLLFREAMSNIVRHAGAGRVEVQCDVVDDCLELAISDDGRGFDPAGTFDGAGLRNVRQRASALGARLGIDSAPGRGTRIRLCMPLTQSGRGRRGRGGGSSS